MSDFPVTVDKNAATPLWIQIRDQIIQLIRTGALAPNEKMPTVRGLASQLSVSMSVVNQCYRYLRATGYLESRQGSGVRVRRRDDNVDDADFAKIARIIEKFISDCTALGMSPSGIVDAVGYAVAARTLDPDGHFTIIDIYQEVTGEQEPFGLSVDEGPEREGGRLAE